MSNEQQTPAPAEARPGDEWDCGNGHLPAQIAILITIENGVKDPAAMRILEDWATGAGPTFCDSLIKEVARDRADRGLPF